jgi:hypothetical protein
MKTLFLIMISFYLLQADYIRDNSSSIVMDTTTKLMWQDDTTPSTMDWTSAISYCEALTLGAYTDWRLPNIIELTSLVKFSSYNPAIDSTFQNTNTNHYWSSTTNKSDTTKAIDVNFISASHHSEVKTSTIYVRCVRAGQ